MNEVKEEHLGKDVRPWPGGLCVGSFDDMKTLFQSKLSRMQLIRVGTI